ncbi:MAG: PSD1 and planctomycete cytochrome C domain-containing protein [Planctomycetota bacterium]|nr:PSD1 and planctomycete cytochrome C domain-containing protein [Planctomycetota bacterium]
MWNRCLILLNIALLHSPLCCHWQLHATEQIDFRTQVAPILQQHCLRCHSDGKSSGELSLTTGANLAEQQLVVPGKPDQSRLIEVITPAAAGKRPEMPQEGPSLTAEEIGTLRDWVGGGALWPANLEIKSPTSASKSWWSLQPLSTPVPPAPLQALSNWPSSPIDQFILRRLQDNELAPSSLADRRTLIRRLTFDLTGLPPTPADVHSFVTDQNPTAYEKLIDRLLASPQYGERWGRHWLDVMRFGESNGYEQNHVRDNAWPFRDYVIQSFNEDKPFDRFVLEQLAGDIVGQGNPQIEVATGFLVAGSFDSVGNGNPIARRLIRANTLDDVIAATGSSFLGLTINCCRCHDHKFDPLAQLDYYRVRAAFEGLQQTARTLTTTAQKQRHDAQRGPLVQKLSNVEAQIAELRRTVDKRVSEERQTLIEKLFPRPPVSKYGTTETFTPIEAKFFRFTILRSTGAAGKSAVSLDEFELFSAEDSTQNLALATSGAKASVRSMRYSNDDPLAYGAHHLNDGRFDAVWISGEPGGQLTIEFPQVVKIGSATWSVDRIRAYTPTRSGAFSAEYVLEASRDGKQWTAIAGHAGRQPYDKSRLNEQLFLEALQPEEQEHHNTLLKLRQSVQQELAAIKPLPTAWIGTFSEPAEPTYLMKGGDPEKKGPNVVPASLSVLDQVVPSYQLAEDAPEASRRQKLAQWITHPENPLTPRVLANRIWHYHFGRGIVATPSDLGYNGGRPSHPQLLDWLAQQVRIRQWRWKPLHRLILTSETYRQASSFHAKSAQMDADARLLWRFPPGRLTAEAIRDSILEVAGRLEHKMGGAGFRLYEYTVDNVATYYPRNDVGQETYRRAVYHQNARAVKVDLLGEYDLPECALPAPQRNVTTSPLQALTLQNHSFMIDMARSFANRLRLESGPGNIDDQITRAYHLAFARNPIAEESAAAHRLIKDFGLLVFCRALYNANEFIYVH